MQHVGVAITGPSLACVCRLLALVEERCFKVYFLHVFSFLHPFLLPGFPHFFSKEHVLTMYSASVCGCSGSSFLFRIGLQSRALSGRSKLLPRRGDADTLGAATCALVCPPQDLRTADCFSASDLVSVKRAFLVWRSLGCCSEGAGEGRACELVWRKDDSCTYHLRKGVTVCSVGGPGKKERLVTKRRLCVELRHEADRIHQ
jgi:hypothetical protein